MPPPTVRGRLGTYQLPTVDACDQTIRSLTAALVKGASEQAQAPIRADIDLILEHRHHLAHNEDQ